MAENMIKIDTSALEPDAQHALMHTMAALIDIFNALVASGVPVQLVANAAMKSTARFLYYVSSDCYRQTVPDEEIAELAEFFREEMILNRDDATQAQPPGQPANSLN